MAKATKPKAATTKKAEQVTPELPKEETVTVGAMSAEIDSPATEIEMPKSEAIEKGLIQPEPEKKKEEADTINITPFEKKPILSATLEMAAEKIFIPNDDLSIEQKILNYLDGKTGDVPLNAFLKGLFPSKEPNAPAEWTQQPNVKSIKVALEALVSKGEVIIDNNSHKLLCTFHYPDASTLKTAYRGLNDIQIIAKK